MRRRRRPVVPAELVERIDAALAEVDRAREAEAAVAAAGAPMAERRRSHAEVTRAFDVADALLREATALAKQHSYRAWGAWRHRLSTLGTARQLHLFAERDDPGVLPLGCVRAVDTGMSGPAIGDLLHGRSREPGAAATYGVDLERLMLHGPPAARVVRHAPPTGVTVLAAPRTAPEAPSAAA